MDLSTAEGWEWLNSVLHPYVRASDDPDAPALVGELSHLLSLLGGRDEDLELAAGMVGLAFRTPGDDGDWAAWRIVCGHVRASQYDAGPSAELLDEALRWNEEAADGLEPGREEAVDLAESRGSAACRPSRYARAASTSCSSSTCRAARTVGRSSSSTTAAI